ncbi:MAG: flagellar hook-length control protein FliK [Pseudomonadota bacterium]
MSAPTITAPATPTSASTRKVADTASASQSTDDAPADLFQGLMQALSAVPDDAVPADTGNAITLSEGFSVPTQEAVLPPEFLGLGLALPQAIPLPLPTVRDTAQGQPLPLASDSTVTPNPTPIELNREAQSPTHALLALVRGHTPGTETPAPTTMTAMAAATPRPAPEAGAANLMAAPEPTTNKSARPGLASVLDTAAKGQDIPLTEPFQPATPGAIDLASGFRQAVNHATESTAIYRNTLQTQPSSPAFQTELVSEVRFLVKGGLQHAELRMNPAELGPIQIELRLSSQVADIGFTAAHAATREGITQSLPQLREMLNSQGLSLGQTSVGAETQGQQQAPQDRPRFDASPRTVEDRTTTAVTDMRVGGNTQRAQGVLDLYA